MINRCTDFIVVLAKYLFFGFAVLNLKPLSSFKNTHIFLFKRQGVNNTYARKCKAIVHVK